MADDLPPLPPGFEVEKRPPSRGGMFGRGNPSRQGQRLRTAPVDGDTFRLNARLYGADAFEGEQVVTLPDGSTVPIGRQAQEFLQSRVGPQTRVQFRGEQTYGRPVASFYNGEDDVALQLLRNGLAVVTPEYLAGDPERLRLYQEAEAYARQNRLGAFAGTFEAPSAYRRARGGGLPSELAPAPLAVGRQPMTGEQATQYNALLRAPGTRPEQLQAWAQGQGFTIGEPNALLSFARHNPSASFDPAFLGTEGGTPEWEAARPGVVTRHLGALNEGIADIAGFPVDVVNAGLGALGLPVSDRPLLGSEQLRDWMHSAGIGQPNDGYAPRGDVERFTQAIARGAGQAALPLGGTVAAGGRLAMSAPSALSASSATRMAARDLLASAARAPGVTAAAEIASGAGAQVGSEIAGDIAPGNPWVDMGAQLVGGGLGGVAAGVGAARVGRAAAARSAGEALPLPYAANDFDVPPDVTITGMTADGRPFGEYPDGVLWLAPQVAEVGGTPPAPPVGVRPVDRLDVAGQPQGDAIAPLGYDLPAVPAVRPELAPPAPPAPRSVEEALPGLQTWAAGRAGEFFHGSPSSGITSLDPYNRGKYGLFGQGTYLTESPTVAAGYARGVGNPDATVYGVAHNITNPLDMDAPANLDAWRSATDGDLFFDGLPLQPGMTNEDVYKLAEQAIADRGDVPRWEGAEAMSDLVRRLGHDGMTHIGGGRVNPDGPRHRVMIALDPEQTTIRGSYPLGAQMNPRAPDYLDLSGGVAAADNLPPLPDGFQIERTAAMDADPMPSLAGPAAPRVRDVIDVNAARPVPMGAPITDAQMRAAAANIRPRDVLPMPSNEIASVDEAMRASEGLYRPLPAPNENAVLTPRTLSHGGDGARAVPKRGPADLITWLRTQGGLRDYGGELRHMGIDNSPRADDFARGDQRFGRLVDDARGMDLDYAALRAWEAGYFPELPDRPSVDEFLDALRDTWDGTNRRFLPEDLAEVEAFDRARDTRIAVERARQDGAPIVEDMGQPVTLADMEANTPPASAFDELPGGQPDFAGNIRLGNLNSPQDISRALASSHARVGGFDGATRRRVTQAETERLAGELGMTPDSLLQRRKGQAFNAEEALAARQILAKSGNELVNLARRVQRLDNPGDELLDAFQRAWVRHVAIQEQIAGMTAEAGRALAQFRMLADSRAVRGDVLAAAIQGGGGADRLRRAADIIIEGNANGNLNVEAARALKPTLSDKLVELWYNSLLSGPQTHVVNVLSNTLTSLGQLPEQAIAAGIGGARRVLSRSQVDAVLFSEVGARATGLLAGIREGAGEFARTLRTGEPADPVTKVEARTQKAISGLKGEVLRVPTRLLAAEDELFKAMARRMELHGQAVRLARKEGLRGDAARARAAELVAKPTDEMLKQALDYGRYLTFQRPLGPVGQSVLRITQELPVLKLVLPFVRTPTNLLKFTVERSPLAPVLKEWRADVRAGGARRDLAVARALVGTAFGAAMAEAAATGLITGGPPTDDRRAGMMRANGWQPYSIYWNGRYYSYQRLDPFAMTIGTAADMATRADGMTDGQREDMATNLVASFLAQLSDKTWLSGVSDLVQALHDPERYMDGFLRRMVGSLTVPTGVAQVARTIDPEARARDSMGDAIQARLPVLSQSLPPMRDVLGRPVENQGGVGPDIFSPVWLSQGRNDPVLNELLASGVSFERPDRTVRGRRLTSQEYDAYQAATGRIAYPMLQDLIAPAAWDALPQDDKQEAVRDLMREARAAARAEVLGGPAPRGMFGSRAPRRSSLPDLPEGFELVQ